MSVAGDSSCLTVMERLRGTHTKTAIADDLRAVSLPKSPAILSSTSKGRKSNRISISRNLEITPLSRRAEKN
jgi:hypothetical protein